MSCGKPPASEEPAHGRARNGLATASLAAGIAGVTLVTIGPALVCGVLGLRRAGRGGPRGRRAGQVRCWAGIGLAVSWAAAGLYLLPHLVRAADPGCAAYKGTALAAYHRVIADFGGVGGNGGAEGGNGGAAGGNGGDGGGITRDMSRAVTRLDQAAARSHSPATARDLSRLARQLQAVLTEIRDGTVVPATALTALNGDAARADAACGTLRV